MDEARTNGCSMGKWSKQEPMVTATARFLNKSRPDLQILCLKFAVNKNEAPRCEQDAYGGGKWLPLFENLILHFKTPEKIR